MDEWKAAGNELGSLSGAASARPAETRLLEQILDASPVATLMVLPDPLAYTIVTANAAYLAATRTQREVIAGQPLFEVFPDDPSEPGADGTTNLRASLLRVIATGIGDVMPDQRYPIPDPERPGEFEERFWAPRNDPVFDAVGEIWAILHTVVDVTASIRQRQTLEDALDESETRFRFLANSLPHVVWMSDTAGNVNFANDTFYAYVGVDRSVPPSEFWLERVHPDDRPRCIATWLDCVAQETDYELEFRIQRHDGQYRWQKVTAVPVRDDQGIISGWYGAGVDVHQMVAAQEETVKLAFRLTSMLESISDGFYTVDREWRFTYVNPQVSELFRRPAVELVGRNVWDAFPNAIDSESYRMHHRAMDGGVAGAMEMYHERLDAWLELRAFPSDEGIAVYLRDITAQHTSARLLRESEAKFSAIAQATADALWDWDIASDQTWWSDGIESLFGHTPADFSGAWENWTLFIHDDDREPVLESLSAAINGTGTEWSAEYRFQTSTGEFVRVADRATIVRDDDGVAVRMLGGMTDVTERHLAQRTIREQAELLNQTSDAILVRTLDDTITYWNHGAEMLYGWTAAEALGKNVRHLLYRGAMEFDRATSAVLQHGTWTGELHHQLRTDDEITVQARWSLIHNEEGTPIAVLSINTDITERKKLEQQFLRAQRMEAIGTLAGGIAHDLNNVLTPIMMSVALLQMDENDSDRQRTLATVLESAKKGADMIRQVLSFARGVDGQRVNVDMSGLIHDVASVARDTFLKTVEVNVVNFPGLWTVEGDPTQLHQVLMNLCVNARDAMPRSGTLHIRAENIELDDYFAGMEPEAHTGPYVVLEVEDSGSGMDAATIERIFDPFFTTKEIGKGTGLGLSTSLAIVKSHSGFIRVYSEPGKGSKFRVYLPASDGVSADGEGTPRQSVVLPRGKGEGILVVDDEITVLEITRQTLEAFGYRVTVASDGASAIAIYAVERANIRAVITDMMMPVMDGLATIHVLRRMNSELPIIAASGLGTNAMDARAFQAGVRHFLSKPYTAETLLVALRSALDSATETSAD